MFILSRVRHVLSLQAKLSPNPRYRVFDIPSEFFENFIPNGQTCDVVHRGMGWVHPLSNGLFEQYPQEIMSIFIAPRRVSVAVYENVEWAEVEWSIGNYIGHYLEENNICVPPVKEYGELDDDLTCKDSDSEVVQCIKELLREQVRPMLLRDGGDVKFLDFDETSGVVSLAMLGACRTCPSSSNTLYHGIERVMKHFLPEVTAVKEDKTFAQDEKYGLVIDSEKALYNEIARIDRERKQKLRKYLTPSVASFEELNEPDG